MSQEKSITGGLAIFRGKEIRKVIHHEEWWFSVIDIIEVLSGTDRPRKYWSDLKKKLISEGSNELSEKIGQLKISAPDGKRHAELNCFRVNASQPLSVWQAKGWIHPQDPCGWFEWYCRYFLGRRTDDDERQIRRWRATETTASPPPLGL